VFATLLQWKHRKLWPSREKIIFWINKVEIVATRVSEFMTFFFLSFFLSFSCENDDNVLRVSRLIDLLSTGMTISKSHRDPKLATQLFKQRKSAHTTSVFVCSWDKRNRRNVCLLDLWHKRWGVSKSPDTCSWCNQNPAIVRSSEKNNETFQTARMAGIISAICQSEMGRDGKYCNPISILQASGWKEGG